MPKLHTVWILTLSVVFSALAPSSASSQTPSPADTLWYRSPARTWTEALPVGNGRLGAMIFGGTAVERIQFNDSDVWTGRPRAYHREGAVDSLPRIRELLFAGKRKEAEDFAMKTFMSDPLWQKAYQPTGDCWVELPTLGPVTDYRRSLDLDAAVATTTYRDAGVLIRREVRISAPDGVMLVTITSDQPGKLNGRLRLSSPHKNSRVELAGSDLQLTGQVETDGVRFAARLSAKATDGALRPEGNTLVIAGVTRLSLRLATGTNVVSYRELAGDPAARADAMLQSAATRSDADLIARQLTDHRTLYRRSTLNLGTTPAASAPTDERIAAYASGQDPDLAALVYRYGRYLLISASRPGGQVATLQGLWNQDLKPAWDSKMTCNINTQMNYWPADLTSLSETTAPLFDAIAELAISGKETARAHYGARGWVVHHNFDRWRGSAPINHSDHGIWQTGGAWLAWHLWEHWQFTRDRAALAQHYPLMREAVTFFEDSVVADPVTGALLVGPSNSPEQGGLVMGPTMDHQIVRSLLRATAEAAQVLGLDPERQTRWREIATRIAPNKIGKHGQLQEWMQDVDDPDNKHRHVSHLWGVYPGDEINTGTPALLKAAQTSLEHRGDEATGWSMGWKINLWARFRDGDRAYALLGNLIRPADELSGGQRSGLYPNLFDAHPPFQIDGNFGATAGIVEMLIQSHERDASGRPCIDLLPALPKIWPQGSITGIRARGGLTLDLAWAQGRPSRLAVQAIEPVSVVVRIGEKALPLLLKAGEKRVLTSF